MSGDTQRYTFTRLRNKIDGFSFGTGLARLFYNVVASINQSPTVATTHPAFYSARQFAVRQQTFADKPIFLTNWVRYQLIARSTDFSQRARCPQ